MRMHAGMEKADSDLMPKVAWSQEHFSRLFSHQPTSNFSENPLQSTKRAPQAAKDSKRTRKSGRAFEWEYVGLSAWRAQVGTHQLLL